MAIGKLLLWTLGFVLFFVTSRALPEYQMFLICLISINTLIALGLVVVTGIGGQISLAQAAFVAIGAYGSAIMESRYGIPMYLGIIVSGLGSAAVGYVLGQITLRVSGHYLALATMAFTAIIQLAIINLEWLTGGAAGMPVPAMTFGNYVLDSGATLYFLVVPVCVASLIVVRKVTLSRIGRGFAAIRQSEIAASAMGINVLQYKACAFAASAFLGALGGGLLGVLSTYLDPGQFGITQTIYYLAIVVVGGLASPMGALLGSIIFVLIPEMLQAFQSYLGLVFAMLLLLSILLRPNGLWSLLEYAQYARSALVKVRRQG